MIRYNAYRSYLKKRFGKPVLKVPLNAGFLCPNRDGVIGRDGCSFCDNRSFSPVAGTAASTLDQLTRAIAKDQGRHGAFIAYLQPFSNTYGDVTRLQGIYEPLIGQPNVVGLSVGTRPDCLQSDVCDYLEDVSKRTYVSVEIGLQSGNEETLRYNRRGHDVHAFIDAVRRLNARGIETVAHVMIGLPPESAEQSVSTAELLASLPVTGIKIHQLMIISGTQIHQWYEEGSVKPLTLEEYAETVCDFLACVRPDQHIHRVMADSSVKNGLVAPLWSAEKMKSINYIHKMMDKKNLMQGSGYR